jgi:hypothetical protein
MSKLLVAAMLLALIAVAGCTIYLCSDSIFWGWTPGNIAKSKSIGDSLIAKIELFADENKRLPKQLSDLVPKYLKRIPPPTAGEGRWDYRTWEDGRTFSLKFSMPKDKTWHGYPKCFYESGYGFWYLDD